MNNTFKQLKEARKDKKLKLEDVAKALNVNRQTVGSWESGKHSPTVAQLENYADFIGASIIIQTAQKTAEIAKKLQKVAEIERILGE